MKASHPRLRMFAGPNASGKSTIKTVVNDKLLGVYINPDDIERETREQGYFDTSAFGITTTLKEVTAAFRAHGLFQKSNLAPHLAGFSYHHGKLFYRDLDPNSYFAAIICDFLRRKLLEKRESFSFETVMSHHDKVEVLTQAQSLGYRTYLYYVATKDPEINAQRLRNRVSFGGHDVPLDKMRTRYYRSLDLLWEAIQHTNRAYIFDNSRSSPSPEAMWLAEITDGKVLEFKVKRLPNWFKKYILDKAQVSVDELYQEK